MIKVYANLIMNGLKTLDKVPMKFRLAVEALLVQMGWSNEHDQN